MVETERHTVGTTAVAVASNEREPQQGRVSTEALTRTYLLKNVTGTAAVHLGDEDVTDSTGFEWAADDPPLEIALEVDEVLYARAASDQTIHVLSAGR